MLKEQTNSNNCLTKNYVGIDIGKKMLEIVRINTKSGKLERNQIKTNASGISELTKWLKLNDVIALEAGNQAFRIAKTLLLEKFDVIVLNPGDIKTIYASLKKTDKEDSLKLARLIQRNPREELPEVSVPSDDIEDTRRLISEQEYWVKKETSLKNRLHSLFVQAGLTEITKKHLDCHKNALITVEELPLRYKKEAERLLIEFKQIEINLEVVKNEITIKLQENISYTTMAMSLPGIGPITALTLYAYLGSCDRFSNSSQVSYYAGLVPRVDCSGETIKYGRIIKRGLPPIKTIVNTVCLGCYKNKCRDNF